jgi:transposase
VSRYFPNAVPVVDSFHVIQWITHKLDMYIRDLMDESFLEYDKDAIQKLINENANTIDRVKQATKFLKQWLK